ncbi:MAG: aminotransferase class V-fold PLP-dependent enzyme, partial [Erysipelotrichales bacterium]|nr:aminotransferase class V-fold PLP-dependent enzyme [Erysipelotrichales bacterium]
MVDLSVYRKDFPMLDHKTMNGYPLVYFDNAATTLKPRAVIDTVLKYYEDETTNVERGDSSLSAMVS